MGLGIPMALNYSLIAVGSMILQSAVNVFGSSAVAAFTAASKVEQISTQPMPALGTTMSTYCGQNLGAGKYDRIFDGMKKAFPMDKIVNVCKQYGFIFQGSEIYGGLANTWDYGPLGARLKNNIKDAWRKKFIQERDNAYEVDADILMHPRVWEASGHVDSFADPLIDCRECKTRHRADNLINDFTNSSIGDAMTNEEMINYINEHKVPCPKCGKTNFTDIRQFKLMFETYRGVIKDAKSVVYLRPENAQGEYVNFLNVQRSMRAKLPFSIGQIGKAFRNEITPGNFTFRTIEFEQMEYQTFCKKGSDMELYEYFKNFGKNFYMSLGIHVQEPADFRRIIA